MNLFRMKMKHLKLLLITLTTLLVLKLFVYDLISDTTDAKSQDTDQTVQKHRAVVTGFTPKLFDSPQQNEQYAKYTALNKKNARDFKTFMPKPGKVAKMNSEPFYLIVEFTKIFSQTKFCHMNNKKLLFASSGGKDATNGELFNKLKQDATNAAPFTQLDKCAYKNCLFSCDKSLAKQADAVLFHYTDLKNNIEAKVRNLNNLNEVAGFMRDYLKFKRESSQVWIFWNDETNPVAQAMDLFKFNYTISYNAMGEVSYGAYGTYGKLSVRLADAEFEKKVKNEFETRKSELARHYPVRVHGSCADAIVRDANKPNRLVAGNSCERGSACEMTTMRSYKFFLALESRNCTDYITEKFWRSLSHGLIPVVIQPPRHFYEKLAPPNSFIHAGDFSFNAQKLADFLTRVAGDAKLYASFSEWKRDYTPLHRGEYLEPLRICELCYKLNNEHREPAFSSYTSISSWFNSQCFKQ